MAHHRVITTKVFGAALIWMVGCGGGEAGPVDPPAPQVVAQAAMAFFIDAENTGDGSDLRAGINRPQSEVGIAEYRVYVIPAASAGGFNATAAAAAPTSSYRVVGTGSGTSEVEWSATSTDTDGATIVDGGSYVAKVYSVPQSESFTATISGGSRTVTIARTHLVQTVTGVIQAGSGGMDADAAGDIYFADFGATLSGPPGTRVYKITPAGQVSTFATGLQGASGNHFDSEGNLFQSNISGGRVSKITPAGVVSTFVTEGIAGPVGIAIDAENTLYVANCSDHTIRKVLADGTSTAFASGGGLSCPNGITLADDGNLYVANFGNGAVLRVSPEGAVTPFVTLPGNNNGHLLFGNGVLYVVARTANQIYEVTLEGDVTLIAGSGTRGIVDGSALDAQLSVTNDVALSPDGKTLYFNDVADVTTPGTQTISPVLIRKIVFVDGVGDGS